MLVLASRFAEFQPFLTSYPSHPPLSAMAMIQENIFWVIIKYVSEHLRQELDWGDSSPKALWK